MSLSSRSETTASTSDSEETPLPPIQSRTTTFQEFLSGITDGQTNRGREQQGRWGEDPLQTSQPNTDRNASTEARRLSLIAADRKRRLTDSADGPGRRRTNSGGFHTRDMDAHGVSGASSSMQTNRQPAVQPAFTRIMSGQSQNGRPLPAVPPGGSGGSGRGESTVPRWQLDAEVSKCPICGLQFTWYFRKHHCRKCGRVVCANCSPHRITIPRQFIVHQTDLKPPSSALSPPTPSNIIDLTGDDEISERTGERPTLRRPGSSQYSNPALGGGEEVRLCNPCVPDPQPDHQPPFSPPSHTGQGSRWPAGADFRTGWEAFQRQNSLPRENQTNAWLAEQARVELRRQRGRGMIFTPEHQTGDATRTRPSEIPDESLPEYGRFDVTVVPDLQRRGVPPMYRQNSNEAGPPGYSSSSAAIQGSSMFRNSMPATNYIPSSMRRSQGMQSTSHDQHRDSRHSGDFLGQRPRVRSMLDVSPSRHPMIDTTRPPRPRLHERDICPICRHALPPRRSDGDETLREQHIMDCIASRDPSYMSHSPPAQTTSTPELGNTLSIIVPHASPPRPRPPPNRAAAASPVHMLRFTATEKDCTAEDGTLQECTICMGEYEVGERLVRLECLCKFHEECILGWFQRKRECPLHARDERQAI